MSHYRQYMRDENLKIPRSTRFYRQRRGEEDAHSDSSDDENWRNCNIDFLLNEDISDNNTSCSDADDQIPVRSAENSCAQLCTNESSSNEDHIVERNGFEIESSLSEIDHVQNNMLPLVQNILESSQSQESSNQSYQNDWINDLFRNENSDMDEINSGNSSVNENIEENNLEDLLNISNSVNFFSNLKETLEKDVNNEVIDVPVVVTKVEMLLAITKFSAENNLPTMGIANLCKMINSFFASSILPDTRYHIDKLFNCKNNVEYHSICSKCKRYIKKFSQVDRVARCSVCETTILLKSPTYTDFFAIINVNNQLTNFIEENSNQYQSAINKRIQNDNDGRTKDFADGYLYRKFINSLPDDDKLSCLTSTFNSDGSPVFESSSFSIWPIQFIINEMPFNKRTKKPLVCGIWFGKDKPDMNIFLKPFVSYMNELSTTGIKCMINNEQRCIKIYALCCCVDSVARAPMQGINQFNGHYGCSWCLHPGLYVKYEQRGGSMKYILLDDEVSLRTERDTITKMQGSLTSRRHIYGVKHPTVLLLLNKFNVVSGFVPDNMHCVNLGIAKQFLGYWIDTNQLPFSFNKTEIDVIESFLENVKAPNQITRLCRSLKHRKWWNARELENWVLYYSLPILKLFPHFETYANHWKLLVTAYHILLQSTITREKLCKAHEMLKEFVILTETYYTHRAMTYNVHQLLHLAQSVLHWGPLWAHSGYCFENGNGLLKNKVHAAKGVVHQVCRAISMEQSLLLLRRHVQDKNPDSSVLNYYFYLNDNETKTTLKIDKIRYFGKVYSTSRKWIEKLHLSNNCRTYRKIVKESCIYTSFRKIRLRSSNSFAITSGGSYIRILDFIIDLNELKEYTICNPINVQEDDNPVKIITNISNELIVVETETIERLCVFMDFGNTQYVCAVPNSCHY